MQNSTASCSYRKPVQRTERVRRLSLVHPTERASAILLRGEHRILGRLDGPGRFGLDDPEASRSHAELEFVSDFNVYRIKDCGSKNGTFVNGRKVTDEYLQPGSIIRIGRSLLVYSEATISDQAVIGEPPVGVSIARFQTERFADLVASSNLPVLIGGPTGAGKELLARRIHEQSGRRGALVAVNCAALQHELLGSELFGHVKGAFSGATANRPGLFAAAQGGTIFLDEIGDLPWAQQAPLLRVLQERCVRPVGSDEEISVDARVIAASHLDLGELERKGGFRPDLFHRLAAVRIELPALASRGEEIIPLFSSFLGEHHAPITSACAEALLLHAWPGNVRELQQVAHVTQLAARGAPEIDLRHLPEQIFGAGPSASVDGKKRRDVLDRKALVDLLEVHHGKIADVARETGESRQRIYRLLDAHGIDLEKFRGRGPPAEGERGGGDEQRLGGGVRSGSRGPAPSANSKG